MEIKGGLNIDLFLPIDVLRFLGKFHVSHTFPGKYSYFSGGSILNTFPPLESGKERNVKLIKCTTDNFEI